MGFEAKTTDVTGDGEEPRSDEHVPLEDVGEDPDPRFTLANERTFLAWNRTALALIAAGLAVAQLLHYGSTAARLVVALPLIALGAAVAFTSYNRWEENERAMRLGRPLVYSRLPRLLALGVGIVAVIGGVVAVVDLLTR
jgi:putative membrane protein